MPTEFFYTQNGKAAPTPVPADQLRQLASSGQLLPTDMVWKEGMPAWLPAATVKGLFGSTKPPTQEMPVLNAGAPVDKAPSAKGPRAVTKLVVESPPESATTEPAQPTTPTAPAHGLSPVVVLLLTLVTGGIFGIIYALRQPADPASGPAKDSAPPLGTARHPVRVAVLSYLTLYIYLAWWAHVLVKECAAYLDRRDLSGRADLALMFAFPPYAIYIIAFRLPGLVQQARARAGLPEAVGLRQAALFAGVTRLPFLPVLGSAIQDALNEVWAAGR